MSRTGVTLTRFIGETEADGAADFADLLGHIGLAGKLVTRDLRRAGLIDILGVTGETNVQGEAVKKLDTLANDNLIKVFPHSGLVCAIGSEEMEKPLYLPDNLPRGRYMLLFDPLDGSSNTDVNMPMGTIFSILRYNGKAGAPSDAPRIEPNARTVLYAPLPPANESMTRPVAASMRKIVSISLSGTSNRSSSCTCRSIWALSRAALSAPGRRIIATTTVATTSSPTPRSRIERSR